MRLDMIGPDHFIVTDDASFVNLNLAQARKIWSNLHLDYPDLFIFIGESVLETQPARRSLQVMVDRVGKIAEAMGSIESGVVKHAKAIKPKKGDVRKPAHPTAQPAPVVCDERDGDIPVLPSISIEDIPTAPVFRWEPRVARQFGRALEPVGAE